MAEVQSDLVLNVDQALAQVEELAAQISAATEGVVVEVSADTAPAQTEIDGLSTDPVEVPVELSFADDLGSFFDDLNAIEVEANTAPALAEVDGLFEEVGVLEVVVEADTSQAQESVEGLAESASSAGGGVSDLTGQVGLLAAAQAAGSKGAVGLAQALTSAGSGAAVAATGIGALGFGAFQLADAYGEAATVAAHTDLIISNTGGNANITAQEVASLASEIQSYSGFSDEAIASGANLALGMENIRNEAGENNDIFTRLITVSADYAAFTGGEVTSATQRFARALNDPVRGMSLLRRSGILFTEEQQELVTSLVSTGDVLGAQRVLLDSLEGRYRDTARTLGQELPGQLARAREQFGELAEEIGEHVAPVFISAAEGARDFIDSLDTLGGALEDIPGLDEIGLGDILTGFRDTASVRDFSLALRRMVREGEGILPDSDDPTGLVSYEQGLINQNIAERLNEIRAAAVEGAEGMGELADETGRAGEATRLLGDEWGGLSDRLSDFEATLAAQDALASFRDAAFEAFGEESQGGIRITAEEIRGLNHDMIGLIESFARVAESQNTAADGSVNYRGRNEDLRTSLAGLAAFIPAALRPQFRLLTQDILAVPNRVIIELDTNVAFVRREFELLQGAISNAGAVAASHQASFHGVAEPPRVGRGRGESAVVTESIQVNVDARGATDPTGVGVAVAEALAPHRARLQIRLNQPAGV